MKRCSLLIFTFILSAISVVKTNAQEPMGPEFLGIWCIINIDLTNDPVNPNGELIYEIEDPPEGAGLMGYSSGDVNGDYSQWIEYGNIPLTGPGIPYVIKDGHTLEVHIQKRAIKLGMMDSETATFDCGLPVKKTVIIIGSRPVTYQQCFYTVRLEVKI